MGMRTKSGGIVVAGLVMLGWIATFAEAGKPISSAPPFSSVPPSGSVISTAGQAYGFCATGVAAVLSGCISQAAGDTSTIAGCVAAAEAGAQDCHDNFFTSLSNAAQ